MSRARDDATPLLPRELAKASPYYALGCNSMLHCCRECSQSHRQEATALSLPQCNDTPGAYCHLQQACSRASCGNGLVFSAASCILSSEAVDTSLLEDFCVVSQQKLQDAFPGAQPTSLTRQKIFEQLLKECLRHV